MKISQKIPLLASVIVLATFTVFSWFQYNVTRTALYDTLESSVGETSQALASQISNWLNGKIALIDMMANEISVDYSRNTVQRVMDNPLLHDEFILIFGALEANGKPISNTPTWAPPVGWDGRTRPWYSLASVEDRALLTAPYVDSATGNILISVVANVQDKGDFRGAFGGDLSLETVSKTVNTLSFDDKGYAFLLNGEGTIISHPDSVLNGKELNTLFALNKPTNTNGFIELESGGQEVLVKFTPISGLYTKDWRIGVVLDKSKVMAQAESLKITAIIAALISALLTSLILYFTMARLFLTPIERLVKITEELSLGKLDSELVESKRNDEIGVLAKAIERMGVSIQLAIKRLEKK